VAVPLSLTMGWTNSPPTFCTTSKMAADLVNANLEAAASAHESWVPMTTSEDSNHGTSPHGAATAHCLEASVPAHDSWALVAPTSEQTTHPAKDQARPTKQMPICRPPPENRPPLL
jgi:hypothetical protein